MREMLHHKRRRFQDLQDALPGIAPNTLSHRLKLLEQSAILKREFYEENPPRAEYVLTEKGAARPEVEGVIHLEDTPAALNAVLRVALNLDGTETAFRSTVTAPPSLTDG